MTILIVSQNLKHYNMQFSVGTIFRVNLAWIDNLHELETITRQLEPGRRLTISEAVKGHSVPDETKALM